MNKQKRIFDVAKELNISHIEIINFLDQKGIKSNIMSIITNEQYSEIIDHFYQEKSQVDRLRKEMARLNVVHHNQQTVHQNIEMVLPIQSVCPHYFAQLLNFQVNQHLHL